MSLAEVMCAGRVVERRISRGRTRAKTEKPLISAEGQGFSVKEVHYACVQQADAENGAGTATAALCLHCQ